MLKPPVGNENYLEFVQKERNPNRCVVGVHVLFFVLCLFQLALGHERALAECGVCDPMIDGYEGVYERSIERH